jgi:putative membrane protein
MGITHTFLDFIPSLVFGIPDPDTALSVLPAHRLLINGEAKKAILLSGYGSYFGMIFAIIISPLVFFGIKYSYDYVKKFVPYLLILVLLIVIISEKSFNNKFWAFLITVFASGLGIFVLNSDVAIEPLLALFTGLFGISGIMYSLGEKNSKISVQKDDVDVKIDKNFCKAIVTGGLSSSVCSVSPGMGNAQAASISSIFFKKITSETFLVVTSAINTINFIVSIITFSTINKARNGSIIVISQLVENFNFGQIILAFIIIFITSTIALFLMIKIGKIALKFASKIDLKKLNIALLVFLFLMVIIISGFYGLLICLCACSLGILVLNIGVRRIHLMSSLTVPIIFNLI